MAREVHTTPANNDGEIDTQTRSEDEERDVFEGAVGMHGEEEDAADEGDGEAAEDEEEAVREAVGEGGHEDGEGGGDDVDGDGVELGFDGGVAVGGDDGGDEVCEAFFQGGGKISSGRV